MCHFILTTFLREQKFDLIWRFLVQSWSLRISQLWKFEWSRRGIESKKREKWEKKKFNAAATGNRTRDLSITDQMSVLTNQVHLKIQFRHRFDQKCPFTDSVPLETKRNNFKTFGHYSKELIHCCSRKLPTQKLVIYFNESSCKRACYCYLVLSWKSQARRLALLLPGNNEKVEGGNSISREKKTQKSRMNCKKRKLFVSRITCAMRECDTNHKLALKASSIQHQNLAHFSYTMYNCNHYFEWNRRGSSEARSESV